MEGCVRYYNKYRLMIKLFKIAKLFRKNNSLILSRRMQDIF